MDYIFEKGKFTEEELEAAIISLFIEEGYDYTDGNTIHRKYDDVLLYDKLYNYLQNRYKSDDVTENEINRIISRLDLISSTSILLT